jgi:hypothetical protein
MSDVIDLTTADRGDVVVDTTEVVETKPESKVDEAIKSVETPEAKPEKTEKEPEKAEKEPEKTEKEGKKGEFIPRERFNEAVGKERAKVEAAQARAKELEGQLVTQKLSEDIAESQKALKDLIKQRNSFLGDGEMDKASEIDEKIIDLQSAIADRKAEAKLEVAKESAKEEIRYDAVVTRIEQDHPQINPDAEEYDPEAVAEIRALMRGYQVEMRLSPSAALSRAAARVFGTAKPAAVAESKAEEAGMRRKAEATERNLAAAKAQPASTKDVGLDHDKKGGGLDAKSVIKLPYDEFSKLGEDVLAKLRGDTL